MQQSIRLTKEDRSFLEVWAKGRMKFKNRLSAEENMILELIEHYAQSGWPDNKEDDIKIPPLVRLEKLKSKKLFKGEIMI